MSVVGNDKQNYPRLEGVPTSDINNLQSLEGKYGEMIQLRLIGASHE